jgi:tRNA A37 threonylcarbamoyladenosine synthetase subunit TsaC/SUA5/YrdC
VLLRRYNVLLVVEVPRAPFDVTVLDRGLTGGGLESSVIELTISEQLLRPGHN